MPGKFLSHAAIMTAIQTWMKAQVLVPSTPSTPAVNLFDDVQFYSQPNLLLAMQELKTFKNRICLIVPTFDEYQYQMSGASVEVHVEREFIFLFCDKDVGFRQKASTGDPNDPAHPGVLALAEYLENNLICQNFNFLPVLLRLRPVNGEAFIMQDKTRADLAGRLGWKMLWRAGAADQVFSVR
jgi:hypothetical protein